MENELPPPIRTTRTLKRIGPLKAGIMLGAIQAALGLCILPFFFVFTALAAHIPASQMPPGQRPFLMLFSGVFALTIPVFYAVIGFVFGVIAAFVYNLAAKVAGGIEVDVE
jgi:hypothetical protein